MKAVSKQLEKNLWQRFVRLLWGNTPTLTRGQSRLRLAYILALAGIVMALNVISYTLASSLFVSHIGASGLPLSYVFVGLVSSPVYGWFSQIVDRVSHERLFRYWALVTGSVVLGLRALLFSDVQPVYYALYIGVYFLWTLQLDILLPTLISDYFTSREYKRVASFITVSQAIGGFLGGLLVSLLASFLSTADMLLLVPVLYLVVFALVWLLQQQEKPIPPEEASRYADAPNQSLKAIVEQYPIVKYLAAAAFLWVVLYSLGEYLYFDAYATIYAGRPEDLTAFLGGFSAVNSMLQVVLLLFLTRRLLLGQVGVDGTNAIYPVTTFFAFLALTVGLSSPWLFPAAIIAHLNAATVDTAINQPVYTLMYNPLPNRHVARVRALTDGLCYALGLAVTGLVLWLSQSFFDAIHIAILGVGLSVVFAFVRYKLSRNYFQALVTRLFSRSDAMDLEVVDELFQHFPDNQIGRLKQLLRDGSEKDRTKALRLAASLRVPSRVLPEIDPLMVGADVSLRRGLLRFFAKTRDDLELSRFLWQMMRFHNREGQLLAFEALVARREPIADRDLEILVRNPNSAIAGLACVLAQQRSNLSEEARQYCTAFWQSPMDDTTKIVVIRGIRNTGDATMIPQLRDLLQDASVDVQVEVLKGLAELSPEGDLTLGELATRFLDHPNPAVRGAALDLLGAVQLPQFWEEIARSLEDTDITVRGQATQALAKYEDRNLDRLAAEYLHQTRTEVAEAAVAVLAQVKTSRAFYLLEEHLQADYQRADLIRAWWQQVPTDAPQWQPLVGVFRDRAQQVVDRVFHVLSCLGNRRTLMEVRQLLQRREKRDRDNALETLETIPYRRYVLPVLPLIEHPDAPAVSQVSAEIADGDRHLALLNDLLAVEDNWLRAGALRVWASYETELPPQVEGDRDRVIRTLVREMTATANGSPPDFTLDRLLFLQSLPLFAEFSLDELWSLDRGFQQPRYDPGDTICEEGEPGTRLLLVYRGRLRAESSLEPEPIVLEPGNYFGDFGLLGETPYPATVRAETKTVMLALSKDSFDVLVDVIPKLPRCMALASRYSSLA